MATCPECDAEIEVGDDDLEEMEEGDPWDCEACGSRLRVASLEPLEFDTDDEADEDDDEDAEKKVGADEDAVTDLDDEDEEDDDAGEDWDE